jgi:hypothetical protein
MILLCEKQNDRVECIPNLLRIGVKLIEQHVAPPELNSFGDLYFYQHIAPNGANGLILYSPSGASCW